MKSFLLAMVILTLGSALGPAVVPRTNGQYRMEAIAFDLTGITRGRAGGPTGAPYLPTRPLCP